MVGGNLVGGLKERICYEQLKKNIFETERGNFKFEF